MKYLLYTLLILLPLQSYGQDFFKDLLIESDSVHNSPFYTIDVDSLNQAFFSTQEVKMTIDAKVQYQVMFSRTISWRHVVGRSAQEAPCTYPGYLASEQLKYLDSSYKKPILYKRHYKNAKIYSGSDLIQKSGVCIKNCERKFATAVKDSVFTSFPMIHERGDLYNRRWMVFSNGDYLVFRYVHSYPYGNQTSFYQERLIYLKRVD